MTNSKSTKRALLSSAFAIMLCAAMLIGTTFAWFTDTASTGVNKIVSGNLDIEVEYRTSSDGDWKTLDNATDLFGAEGNLFEPGHTRVVELKIKNAGNLALKYKIGMNVVSETAGTNKDGNPYKLSDYLKVAATGFQQYPAEGHIAEAMEWAIFQPGMGSMWKSHDFANFYLEYASNGNVHALQPGAAQILGIKVYMPGTVGNEANAFSSEKAASISFGLNVVATQYTTESDSYGTQYDKDAEYPEVQPVATLEKLKEMLASDDIDGKTIKLYDNIDNITNLIISDKNIALDLNGNSMKTNHLQVKKSKIVIKDSSEDGNGKIETTDSYAVVQAENSDVTIESGQFISSYDKEGGYGYAPVISVRNSELTINGGYFENSSTTGNYNYIIKAPCYTSSEKVKITINDGVFVSHGNYGYIITGDSSSNVEAVINGGSFTTEGSNSYLTQVKGSVVVNDCTFIAKGNNTVFDIPSDSTVTVKGGTFSVNENSYSNTSLAGLIFHRKTNGWTSVSGTLLVDPIKPVKVNQETYSGFIATGATQSAKGADGFYTISK